MGDCTETSGSVAFLPGTMSRTISVQVRGDREVEPNETFDVELTSAQNALIVDGSGLATILDDDQGPRPFTVTQANERKEKS